LSIGDTCIGEWDFIFLLKTIEDGRTYNVDVTQGTRDFDIMMVMRDHKLLFVSFGDGFIDRVCITPIGKRYYDHWMSTGYFDNLELGKEITKNLTESWEKAFKQKKLPWQKQNANLQRKGPGSKTSG
jgi:hypothetical protein